MKPWSTLPNAHHIDRIIESLKDRPELWASARDAARLAARAAAWYAARDAARLAAEDAGRIAVLNAGVGAGVGASYGIAWDGAWSSIAALIAWDDSNQYLSMTSSELEVWARLSNNPAAILMLPAVKVFEQIAACLDTGSESAYNHNHALI